MSYDRKIDWACPHQVANEALYLSADRMTVRPIRAIASASSVTVRLNSDIEVPSAGAYEPATMTCTSQGPYTIVSGTNDTLVVRVGRGATQTVTLEPGVNLKTAQIAADLTAKVGGLVFEATPKNRLKIRTQRIGPEASFRFFSGSTVVATLGTVTDRVWTGRRTAPGWTLVRDPRTVDSRPSRWIVFDAPLKGWRDFVEIGYVTAQEDCRRCGGVGIENDWRYNRTGEVVQARDEALLIQDLHKVSFTQQGSNPFHPWYGGNLDDLIGSKNANAGLLTQFIENDIRESFRRWQSIKKDQEERAGQAVSDREFPFRLLETRVTPLDQVTFYISSKVQNRDASAPIDISRGITVPDEMLQTIIDGPIRNSIQGLTRFK